MIEKCYWEEGSKQQWTFYANDNSSLDSLSEKLIIDDVLCSSDEKIENLVLKAEECSRKNCIYVYVFKIFSVSIRKIRNSNIASITFKNPKTIYIYTVFA